ncbi:transcriptional regulator [Lewinellaceae bacterium SD302]|nr:transcriptional regulator [Lewinellaceae bacterium SD302]
MKKRRNTATQTAVLASLQEAESALSHEMIQEKITAKADRTTIYRILNRFCDDGLVHRIVADDGKQYFAICSECEANDHRHDHFHFRCLNCDKVECLDQEVSVNLPTGYRTTNFNGVVSGYCRACNA